MSSGWLIFLIAVGVVAFFVVGMSLTIIFKGHYMESEIGENRHMKARGIRCASQQLARGGGRVARRFLGGRRGVLRRKLLVLYGRLLRRTRSGAVPGRASPCPGPVRQPFRSVGCFSVLSSAVSGGRRQAPARSLPYLHRYSFFMKFSGRVVGYGTRLGLPQRTKNYEDIPANLARGRLLKTRTPADRTGCSGGKSRGARGPRPLFIGVL